MEDHLSKKLTYRHNSEKQTFSASTCIFAVQGYHDKEAHTFLDGEIPQILRLFTALFSTLMKKNLDLAYHALTACMSLMTTEMGIDDETILTEEAQAEELSDEPEIKAEIVSA